MRQRAASWSYVATTRMRSPTGSAMATSVSATRTWSVGSAHQRWFIAERNHSAGVTEHRLSRYPSTTPYQTTEQRFVRPPRQEIWTSNRSVAWEDAVSGTPWRWASICCYLIPGDTRKLFTGSSCAVVAVWHR